MKPDEFARQFHSSDIAHADQNEAAIEARRGEQATNDWIRRESKSQVARFGPFARELVERVNANVSDRSSQLVMIAGSGLFSVMRGREIVTAQEARTSPFGNEGVSDVVVIFSRMPGNFGGRQVENPQTERYEPLRDTDVNAIVWRRKGSSGAGVSLELLVQRVFRTFQERAR